MVKRNQLKEKESRKKKNGGSTSTSFRKGLYQFLSDSRFHRVSGMFLMLVSFFLLISFISYFFTWKADYDKVSGSWWTLLGDSQATTENLLGKLGAMAAHQFLAGWFGIASFLFPFLIFLFSIRILFGFYLLPLARTLAFSLFSLVFVSTLLGYFFSESNVLFMGGAFGFEINKWLAGTVGTIGAGLTILFVFVSFLVTAFNLSLSMFKWPDSLGKIGSWAAFRIPGAVRVSSAANKDGSAVMEDTLLDKAGHGSAADELEDEDPEEQVAEETGTGTTEAEPVMSSTVEIDEGEDENEKQESRKQEESDISEEFLSVDAPGEEEEDETTALQNEDKISEEVLSLDPTTPPVAQSTPPKDGPGELQVEIPEGDMEVPPLPDAETTTTDTEGIHSDEDLLEKLGEYDPTLDLSEYQYPTLDLLEVHASKNTQSREELMAELETNKNRIVETLGHYNIGIDKIKATVGPTVTLFEIVPQAGIRISKIKNLEDDIALSLSALGIRIIAPIPGKGTIGIEVPNQNPEIVAMRTVLASERFINSDYELPIGLGKTISNEVFVTDLTRMPHLLMAGATGQGKSVGLNTVLASLLFKKHPAQVKFVLVDPKKVELSLFKKIERHFLAKLPGEEDAIITDTRKVVNTLNSLCIEMDQRYELLKDAQVRNISEYNRKFVSRKLNPKNGHRFLPYIVLVVDEFADLIMTAGKEIETPLTRLAQLARAIGIHLIIATQRPSVNIITGTIKANFPARLAFRVTSKTDSRTILDTGGADQLIGRGDMLFSTGADLIRLQCAFVDTPEVNHVTEFIGSQRGYPDAFLLPEYVGEESGSPDGVDASDRDPLFEDAARMVVQHQQGSASLLQRRLKLGYNRAGRLVDQLEAAGIIGPFEGSKAREVRVKDLTALEQDYLSPAQ